MRSPLRAELSDRTFSRVERRFLAISQNHKRRPIAKPGMKGVVEPQANVLRAKTVEQARASLTGTETQATQNPEEISETAVRKDENCRRKVVPH